MEELEGLYSPEHGDCGWIAYEKQTISLHVLVNLPGNSLVKMISYTTKITLSIYFPQEFFFSHIEVCVWHHVWSIVNVHISSSTHIHMLLMNIKWTLTKRPNGLYLYGQYHVRLC